MRGMARPIFDERGRSGLEQYGGRISEEFLRHLEGERGRRAFREMMDNDAVVGAILFAIEMLLRNVDWRVESYDDSAARRDDAEFVETLLDDMSHTWEDFIAEALTMLPFGWSCHEIVYKRRMGPDQRDPRKRSKYTDGRIGWRKLAPRAQDSLERWEFDEDGGIKGWWQHVPSVPSPEVFLPIEKLLLFRTTSRKSNPEGRSVLRNSWITYYHKKRIQDYEAIGVERDLAGLPVMWVPPEVAAGKDTDSAAALAEYKRIVQNIKNDEQAGLVLPLAYDENGNKLYDFMLASTGGQRQFDTSKIIERLSRQIAMTVLADFILLGHEKVGSFSLSSDKTALFGNALGAWLKEIAAVMNRHAIPRLYELNGMEVREPARLEPGDLEKDDVERLADAVQKLTGAGFLTPGAEDDENHIRTILGLPELSENLLGEDGMIAQPEPDIEADDVPPGPADPPAPPPRRVA